MFCTKCGTQQPNPNENYCRNCGALLNSQQVNNQPINQTTEQSNNMVNQANSNQNMNYQTNPNQNMNYQTNISNQEQLMPQQPTGQVGGNQVNSNYQESNPDMKIWAILSIVIPIVGTIIAFLLNLPIYTLILMSVLGEWMSKKGVVGNPKLAKIGRIISWVIFGLAVLLIVVSYLA